ncbi:hypothetical protein GCM10025751_49380 [Haladaptatus pallidirubidus]|uniref:Acetyl xylan esterase domain-containing protein n=1 Tax=Haladaptatus pallidirubidus TaxID=1008152 RepID=A0AAV3UQI1_9EURY
MNGYFDTEDQLSRYLLDRAADYASTAHAEKKSINTRTEAEARRERIRETFLSAIGGLPARSTDRSADTIGHIEREGFSIEHLVFESRPNFHVTANCYVPDDDGPHPGILFLCGHLESPKSDPLNQQACAELALNGFVVLILDPLCQGERTQYRDPDSGEAIVSGGGGTFPHIYAGQKCSIAGWNLARYMIADAQRALDVLEQRSDVDDGRLGVTGTSGGGTQTLYLGLVDDRIDVAAPCCAVSERYEQFKTGNRTHAEQAITGSVAHGIDYDDYLAALAPRPVCVGAAASDRYFPIEGVYETVNRVQDIYGFYDAEDRVDLVVGQTTHCAVYDLRDGVFEFLCNHLSDDTYEPQADIPVLDQPEIRCTPDGSVRSAYPDERTIDDLIRADIADAYPTAGTDVDGDGEDVDQLRQELVNRFDLRRSDCDLQPRFVKRTIKNDLDVEYVWFKTEHEPDIVVTGVLVTDPSADSESPTVVLYDQGTSTLPERTEDVTALASKHGTVFVFDPRDVGAVRHRIIPVPNWADDYGGFYGTECKLANDALLLGDSLLAMRVFDTLRAVEFLRSETNSEDVSFVGEGIGAYHALYAAGVAQNVDHVTLRDLEMSFYDLVTSREIPYHPGLTVFDIVDGCDLPDVLVALTERGVDVSHK